MRQQKSATKGKVDAVGTALTSFPTNWSPAQKPWPNDLVDGFHFDLMGPRVPAILVSPWIKQQTVFRSPTEVPYDATSFPATVLRWFGVPRERWGLGDRITQAPTFEAVLQETTARTDAPTLTPPYDKDFPPEGKG